VKNCFLQVRPLSQRIDIQQTTMSFKINVNGVDRAADVGGDTPLLRVLRSERR
jgi:hypothetical protein